jgi:prefoldin subunit 5
MTDESVQRDLGRLEAKVEQLTKQVSDMQSDLEKISTTLAEARGGWRAVAFISGISATLGAGAMKLFSMIPMVRP